MDLPDCSEAWYVANNQSFAASLTALDLVVLLHSGNGMRHASVTVGYTVCLCMLTCCYVCDVVHCKHIPDHQRLFVERSLHSDNPVLGADPSSLPNSDHVSNVFHIV